MEVIRNKGQSREQVSVAALADRLDKLEQVNSVTGTRKKNNFKGQQCNKCTRPTHGPGNCPARNMDCFACERKGHMKGTPACKEFKGTPAYKKAKPKKKKEQTRAVNDSELDSTDSDSEDINRVEEVRAAGDKKKSRTSNIMFYPINKDKEGEAGNVSFLVDSGVHKTLLSEEDWMRVRNNFKLKKNKTKFIPFGTQTRLPMMGKSKCVLKTKSGKMRRTVVYVVKGNSPSLLGLREGEALGVINITVEGGKPREMIAQVENTKKASAPVDGPISGGQTQKDIDNKMEEIVDRFPKVFNGLGRAKVDPVHIEVDESVKPIQQKDRPIAIHLKDKFKKHIEELKGVGVVEGPLKSEEATGWISNVVITAKKWDTDKIRVNLDTRHMGDAIKQTHFPIPTVEQLRHNFAGSDRFTSLDMNHASHQFEMDEDSKQLYVFRTPWGLHRFATLVMGSQPASSECHENLRIIVEGLEGVEQIKDNLVVHGKGEEHDLRLGSCCSVCRSTTSHSGRRNVSGGRPRSSGLDTSSVSRG